MSNFPVVRSKSSFCLPRQRDVDREGTVATLSRVTSVPNINNLYPDLHYRPSSLYRYRRNYNEFDDYVHDRFSYQPTLYWVDCRYQARRYPNTDPIPDSLGLDYPSFWYRYKWYSDFLSPQYWRKHRDPHYDRPLWDSWKPYMLDRSNTKRAIDLYRKGIVSFGYLDRNWITPWALGHRREKDWADVYTPAGWREIPTMKQIVYFLPLVLLVGTGKFGSYYGIARAFDFEIGGKAVGPNFAPDASPFGQFPTTEIVGEENDGAGLIAAVRNFPVIRSSGTRRLIQPPPLKRALWWRHTNPTKPLIGDDAVYLTTA